MARDLLTGSVVASGSIVAATTLEKNSSHAATKSETTVAIGKEMNFERLKRFKEEVHDKAEETVNNSPLFKMFDEYGFPEKTLKVEVIIDLEMIKSTDGLKQLKDDELIGIFSQMSGEEFTVQSCCGCSGRSCNC